MWRKLAEKSMSSVSDVAQHADGVTILETRAASPSHFVMKIESFSLLKDQKFDKYKTGEFKAGGYNWSLIIYPNEDKSGIDSTYISVNLAISDKTAPKPWNWEVNAVFSIFLLNQTSGNYHYSLGRTRCFQAMKSEWGISKFISKKVLMDPSNGFLIDDNCVFGAEVFIVEKLAVTERLSLKNMISPYECQWKFSTKIGVIGCISSDFFVEGLKWHVSVYPDGVFKSHWLGAYLYYDDYKSVKASFSICIKNLINDKHHKYTTTYWFSPRSRCLGWKQFMKLATLEDPKNGYSKNGCFLLKLDLRVHAVV